MLVKVVGPVGGVGAVGAGELDVGVPSDLVLFHSATVDVGKVAIVASVDRRCAQVNGIVVSFQISS